MFTSKSSLKNKISLLETEKTQLISEKSQLETELQSKVETLENENTQLKDQLQQYWQILFNTEQELNNLKRKTNRIRSRYDHYKRQSIALKTENKNLNDHLRHMISKSRPHSRHRSRKEEKKVLIQTDDEIFSPRDDNLLHEDTTIISEEYSYDEDSSHPK